MLTGCVSDRDFPSLALRDVELDRSTEAAPRPPVEIPSDPALRRQIVALAAQARTGDVAFERAYGPAASAMAAAGGEGSESWVEAQQALSRLEAARAETMRALGDLDALAMARANAPTNAGDLAALDTAIDSIEGVALGQQQRLDSLRTRLSRP